MKSADTLEVTTWINEAAATLGVQISEVRTEYARKIIGRARDLFVQGNPRAWWMSLALPCTQYSSDDTKLSDLLFGRGDKCWLVPETGSDDLPVYELAAGDVEALILECPYFEYYVLGQDFSWLVAESDHNEFYVCRIDQGAAVKDGDAGTKGI